MQKNLMKHCLLAVLFLAPMGIRAQVTAGSGKVPESFSVLELVSNEQRGLRLPQIETTARRDEIFTNASGFQSNPLAQGLQIFNMETRCVETWNGTKWIEACAPVICAGFQPVVAFCTDSNPKISDLNGKVGAAVSWYAADTGGEPLPITEDLIHNTTYYAGNCNDQSVRQGVTVELVDCTSAVVASRIRVTTFTNVMYDFQHQTLEAYVSSGSPGTDYQWQVSTSQDGTYTDIPGATSRTYTLPADVIHNPSLVGLSESDFDVMAKNSVRTEGRTTTFKSWHTADGELWFRVKMKNHLNSDWAVLSPDNVLAIAFIKTTDSGQGSASLPDYGGIGTPNPYLTVERSLTGITGDEASGTIKLSLLNLGASEGNDAGDLGDFYQWGRKADGHEKIVWVKRGGSTASTFSPVTDANVVVKGIPSVDTDGQILDSDDTHFGKFIINDRDPCDWGTAATANTRWGNGVNSRAGSSVNATQADAGNPRGWNFPANNVCPDGWRVPSRYEFSDIYRTSSNGEPSSAGNDAYDDTNSANNNRWYWRTGSQGACGGVIIANAAGKKVFLPEIGSRTSNYGIFSFNTPGYWSSTASMSEAYDLRFAIDRVNTGVGTGIAVTLYLSTGKTVRCVAE